MRWLSLTILVIVTLQLNSSPTPKLKKPTDQKKPEVKKTEAKSVHSKTVAKSETAKTPAPDTKKGATNTTETPKLHCSSLISAIGSSGLHQTCKVHKDCMGAACSVSLMEHNMIYDFSVRPCDEPSVTLEYNITDIEGATIKKVYTKSDSITIPKGNMSWEGLYETESTLDIVLEKVLDVTHFRLDFGVQIRVLKSEALRSLWSHTLVPMLTIEFNKEMCVEPTKPPKPVTKSKNGGDSNTILGISKETIDEVMKDKTKLGLVITSVCLGVVVLIGLIYFIIAKKRADNHFYRTYVSTDENRHLTKGNDGFEPLDDSDID